MTIKENFPLKHLNTFGIDVRAKYFTSAATAEDLTGIMESIIFRENRFFILGGGSNLLFRQDFQGLVISVDIQGMEVIEETTDSVIIRAGAGVVWHELVSYCVGRDYWGLENLALIPGKAGAAPVQNIGAYGAEQKDVFHSLEGIDLDRGRLTELSAEDCGFGYRSSIFKTGLKDKFIISSVSYKLGKTPRPNLAYRELKNEIETRSISSPTVSDIFGLVCDIRKKKLPDPSILGNAGSFFKNPVVDIVKYEEIKFRYGDAPSFPAPQPGTVKLPAAWLIEKAGFKGFRKGQAGVSDRHALILVNYGSATGRQIFDLSEDIIGSVDQRFGIRLEREVLVVG